LARRIVTSSPRAASNSKVVDVERDELGASQRGDEPEQEDGPVSQAGERAGVDRVEQARERLELERAGLAQRPHAALAADAGEDRGDRGRVARVGLVLGAVLRRSGAANSPFVLRSIMVIMTSRLENRHF